MAIVLISTKKKQNRWVRTITFLLALVLFSVPLILLNPFWAPDPEIPQVTKPEIRIDTAMINSKKVKQLETFTLLQRDFTYTALNANGKQVSGHVSAVSEQEAQLALEERGLRVILIKHLVVGRQEPFVPYQRSE